MGKKYRELWEHGNFGRFVMKQPDGTIVQYQIPLDLHLLPSNEYMRVDLAIHSREEAEAYLDETEKDCDIVEQDKRFPAKNVIAIRSKISEARKALTGKGLDGAMQYLAVIPHMWAELERAPLEALGRYGKQKHKETSARGGSAPKFRRTIYRAMIDYLRDKPTASNKEVWESLPEGYTEALTVGELGHSVFRDGAKLYEVDSRGKKDKLHWIGRRKFDDYMTAARDELHISTRRKKRSARKESDSITL